jgi:DNA-binding PadR family transcriptional regulator
MRLTLQVQLVLRTLLGEPDRELYGLEFVDATGLPPGTIYPILARIEGAGWIASRWEQIDQHEAGRPRRRYYRLTPDGAELARDGLAAVAARQRRTGGAVGRLATGGASWSG